MYSLPPQTYQEEVTVAKRTVTEQPDGMVDSDTPIIEEGSAGEIDLLDTRMVELDGIELPNTKVPPVKIDCSDCVVHIGRVMDKGKIVEDGIETFPHVGESIWITPVSTVGEQVLAANFVRFSKSTSQEEESELLQMMGDMGDLTFALSARVLAWDWTGEDFAPLAKPWHNHGVFATLQAEELLFLFQRIINPESAAERKNA